MLQSSRFQGKKLLVLGSNAGSVDIVDYARSGGAFVYVADYLPRSESPAKQAASQSVDVSTADIEALVEFAKAQNVDAVFAGVSGFNLLSAMEVSRRCGLWFYCDKRQWDAIEGKDGFRRLCEKHGVPCPATYFIGSRLEDIAWGELDYPVVLKPVDSGASRGVFICRDEGSLRDHINDARDESSNGRIIIESFEEGFEFTVHYVVSSGKATLVSMDNRYPVSVHEGEVTTIPIARVYPSLFLDAYLESVDAPMRKLFESIGLDNAVVFSQGLYNPESEAFCMFEAGMRSAAECPNRFIEAVTDNNYFHFLVDLMLTGSSSYKPTNDDVHLRGKTCAIVSFVAKGGVVGSIEHLEETCAALPSVVAYESRYPVGAETPEGDTLAQLMIRFVMVCDTREQLAHDIEVLNEGIVVKDVHGADMVIKFDGTRVLGFE